MSAAHGARGAITRVEIIVPAHNEADLVGRCLAGLTGARERAAARHPDVACGITVVLDRCEDLTRAIAADVPGVVLVDACCGGAGAARARGVERARRGADPTRTWILSTDADSLVPADWLDGHLALADAGFDLVVGSVEPDPADLAPECLVEWRARHELGLGDPHVFGANLGVRLAAYEQVGGFPAIACGEDVELVRALRSAGVPWAQLNGPRVLTSGRLVGRAPDGFASYLARL